MSSRKSIYIIGLRNVWLLIHETYIKWREDRPMFLAAGMAYFTLFSLIPLMLILVAIAGQMFERTIAKQAVLDQIGIIMNAQAAASIENLLTSSEKVVGNRFTFFSAALVLYGASRVFTQLQIAFKIIWKRSSKEVPHREKTSVHRIVGRTLKEAIRMRLKSILVVLGISVFFFIFFILDFGMLAASHFFSDTSRQGILHLVQSLSPLVSLFLVTTGFGLLYKFVPEETVGWTDVWLGAGLSAFLLTLAKFLLSLYFRYSRSMTLYGAATSVIVMLVWIYFVSQILLIGAEFSRVFALRFGSLAGQED